ncbi:MAG: HDIG domain-containing protein [Candidatus Moraniibacteriota bacterium]|nr:MAG: HDIG domain-containing protein [Candidatus Moranbacteria bacterium]
MHCSVPVPVLETIQVLERAGFKAYIVGGSLRDLVLGRDPKDWDVTTDAKPDAIQKIFPDSVYENTFGTVGVKVPRFLASTPAEYQHDIIEITTFRTESDYQDGRHPEKVDFVSSVEEDLARRDFTINAMAGRITATTENTVVEIIDPFGGQTDIEKKIIRAVGNPEQRFSEDGLRLMRAVRLAIELSSPSQSMPDWSIEPATFTALKKLADTLPRVAFERIRDEFSRIIVSARPSDGVTLLQEVGLLQYVIPELTEGIGVTQNLHHIYTVWEHNLRALATCPSKKLDVRLAALLHDVGKPRTKRGEGYRSTFYNHDHVGARMTRKILERLRYSKKVVDHAAMLVDNHLFYYNVGEVTEASVRRLIKRVGLENMDDLMAVRIGDRLGSGVPKAKPYKLRHLEYMIDKVSQDATSVKMLKIDGSVLMTELHLAPGPKIGALLECLLAEVIDDPGLNVRQLLLDRARQLMDNDLVVLRNLAKERIDRERESEDRAIRGRHRVV